MGSTKQEQNTETQTRPWEATIPGLHNLINQINGQMGNTGLTQNENGALNQLTQNAQQGNPFTQNLFNLAQQLFAGGGPDRSGIAKQAYGDLQGRLGSYADGSHFGAGGNPQLQSYLDTNANDISNRVNGMFAAAGRDFSGANQGAIARGITEGNSPILAQQYNTDVGRQFDASNALYGAGNTTTGLLAGLDQQRLGNKMAAYGVGNQALQARDSGANQMLNIEGMRRNMPLQNIGNLSSLLTPLAQLGGQGESHSTSKTTPPLGMQLVQAFSTLTGGGGGGGGGGWGGSPAGGAANAAKMFAK